jgi:RimJ/RimL family protein N-acetyltransferase
VVVRAVRRAAENALAVTGPFDEAGPVATVRRIQPDDWPRLRDLRLEALKDSPLAFVEQYDESLAEPDEFWQHRASRAADGQERATFIADEESRFTAMAACFLEEPTLAHVVGVYVTPSRRGTGLGDRVIQAAVDWAQTVPAVVRIHLYVTDGNERAAAVYRRLGFVATGTTIPYPPDPTVMEHEMEFRNR